MFAQVDAHLLIYIITIYIVMYIHKVRVRCLNLLLSMYIVAHTTLPYTTYVLPILWFGLHILYTNLIQ